jgi:hypothetical protein
MSMKNIKKMIKREKIDEFISINPPRAGAYAIRGKHFSRFCWRRDFFGREGKRLVG